MVEIIFILFITASPVHTMYVWHLMKVKVKVTQLCLNSLWPHGLQHDKLPCSLPSPRACLHSCPLSLWCHPTISSFSQPSQPLLLFSSCLQSFPADADPDGSFPMSWLFASGGQSIGASASVLPINIQDWFPLGLTGSCSPRASQESSPTPLFKSINSLALSLLHGPTHTSVHYYWENHSFAYKDLCWQSDVSAF